VRSKALQVLQDPLDLEVYQGRPDHKGYQVSRVIGANKALGVREVIEVIKVIRGLKAIPVDHQDPLDLKATQGCKGLEVKKAAKGKEALKVIQVCKALRVRQVPLKRALQSGLIMAGRSIARMKLFGYGT
jgi:hypothetical protein